MGYSWLMVFTASSSLLLRSSSTTLASASRANKPANSPASSVNRHSSSNGAYMGKPRFWAAKKSSSPFPGERCTMPVAVATSTKSSHTTVCITGNLSSSLCFGTMSLKGYSYFTPSRSLPIMTSRISYSLTPSSSIIGSTRCLARIHTSVSTFTLAYSSSG